MKIENNTIVDCTKIISYRFIIDNGIMPVLYLTYNHRKDYEMVKTQRIGSFDYAKVADRLKEFRESNPRASIKTSSTVNTDGSVKFETYILKDKADEYSADATGSAMYNANEMKANKAFEKLESISVGRALSLLGYLNNGEIASSEEMLEFEEFKNSNRMTEIENAITLIENSKTLDELKAVYIGLGKLITIQEIVDAKDKRKAQLNENN